MAGKVSHFPYQSALNTLIKLNMISAKQDGPMLTKTSPSTGSTSPSVVGFYEKDTGSVQYLAIDEASKKE